MRQGEIGIRGRLLHVLVAAIVLASAFLVGVGRAGVGSAEHAVQEGGIFTISMNAAAALDSMDPALASSPPGWALLDTTCARLMSYPDKSPADGIPAPAGGGRGFPDRLRRREDVHVQAAHRLPVQRRKPGACERLRTRDQSHAGARDGLAGGALRPRDRRRRAHAGGQGDEGVGRRGPREHPRRQPHPSRARLPAPNGFDVLLRRAAFAPHRRRGCRAPSRLPVRTASSSTDQASGS